MSSESIFPFLPATAGAPPQVFPYDVVIDEAFPGIQFIPTEPNGQYEEIREVNGTWWFVTNAMWNANLLQWDQESNQNTSLPAYALSLLDNGSMIRYESPATNIPFTPITWTALFQINAEGLIIKTPTALNLPNETAERSIQTWNAGTGVTLNADSFEITDNASNVESSIQLVSVNNTVVWKIRKDGTLEIGQIPFANVTGYTPPSFNNVTLTGTTTMTGPVIAESTVDVDGALTAHSSLTADTTLFVVSNSTLNGGATINSGLTVTGGETVDSLTVTGALDFTGTVTAAPWPNITSPDNSIVVGGTTINPTIKVTSPMPAVLTTTTTVPSVGSTVPISYSSSFSGFPDQSYVIVGNDSGSGQFLGLIVSNSVSGGITTSMITCLQIQLGGVGSPLPAGHAFVFAGSWVPSLGTRGQVFGTATNFSIGATTGSLTISALPGDSSVNYLVICNGSLQFVNGNRILTLTGSGSGVTWPNSPQQYENGQAASFPFTFYGNATGGTAPSVTWTCNDSLGFTPMTMVITAYAQ